MISTKDIQKFLEDFGVCKTPFQKITKNHKNIKSEEEAYESLALLEKILLPKVGDGELNPETQKIYIAIVDTQYVPMEAYAVDVWYDYEFDRKIRSLA